MNKRLLLSTLAAWMLLGVSVHAVADNGDSDFLYLFIGSVPPQQYYMDEEQTVIFKEEKIEVRVAEAVWEVEYEQFEKITLSVAPAEPTEVKAPKTTQSGIDIRYDAVGQQLVVDSAAPLCSIDIFSIQGMKQASAACGDTHGTASLADLPAGIYVVRASDGTNAKTLKIVKR